MCVKKTFSKLCPSGTYLPEKLVSKLSKHFIGYKIINSKGESVIRYRKYSPGIHMARKNGKFNKR